MKAMPDLPEITPEMFKTDSPRHGSAFFQEIDESKAGSLKLSLLSGVEALYRPVEGWFEFISHSDFRCFRAPFAVL